MLLSILMLVTSCQNTTFNAAGCPALVDYSNQQQDSIKSALKPLPSNSPLRSAMDDYANLRKQTRDCQDVK